MRGRCPQDGGFVGDAGCTHPNHRHSALVEGLLAATSPREIHADEAMAALREGFCVERDGKRTVFGKNVLRHFSEPGRNEADTRRRLELLPFAIDTVRTGRMESNHKGIEGRTAYAKRFRDFGVLVLSDKAGKNVEYVFNVIPDRRGRL